MDAGLCEAGGGLAVQGDALQVPPGGVGHQDRLTGAYALGDQAVAVVGGESPGQVGRADRLRGVGRAHGEGAEDGRALVRGGAAVEGAVEQVHAGHIGQDRYHHVGQLAGCRLHVEGGAHTGGSRGDQRQPLPGLCRLGSGSVARGDVDDGVGQTQHPPAGVLQPVVRDGPGVLVVGIVGWPADDVPVHHRLARLQDTPQTRLGVRVQEGQDLTDGPAETLGGGLTGDAFQRGIHGQVPQVRIQNGEPDRGLGHQTHGQGRIPLDPLHGCLVRGETQGVGLTEVVQQPHVAELHEAGTAVLVPDREGPGPVRAGFQDLGEQLDHLVLVLLVDRQGSRVLAQCLRCGPAEQFLGLRTPEDHLALGVQHHRGDAEQIEQAAGRRGTTRCWAVVACSGGLRRAHVSLSFPLGASACAVPAGVLSPSMVGPNRGGTHLDRLRGHRT